MPDAEKTRLCRDMILFSVILIAIGFPIWSGIYFGIYFPLMNRNYETTMCEVASVDQYYGRI